MRQKKVVHGTTNTNNVCRAVADAPEMRRREPRPATTPPKSHRLRPKGAGDDEKTGSAVVNPLGARPAGPARTLSAPAKRVPRPTDT